MRRHYGSLCTEVYDLTKPVGGTYPDVPYYVARLASVDGPVLEAAVGTGRLLIPLLRAGLAVEGLDSSAEMLDRCRHHCAAAGLSPVLYHGALETSPLPKRYRAVIVTLGSFMLFAHAGEGRAALVAIRRALVSGGELYLDVMVPKRRVDLAGARVPVGTFATPDGGEITLERQATYDPVARIERDVLFYEKTRAGVPVAHEVQDVSLRWWEQDELTALLEAAGFDVIACSGDYSDDLPPAGADHWWCFTARSR